MTTPAATRLRDTSLAPAERNLAMWMHLSPLLAFMIVGPFALFAPLALWLSRRTRSAFQDDHGREVVNMSLTGTILLGIGVATGIGVVAWLAWAVVAAIGVIRGAVAASNGEYFRYPMTLRMIH